jgi:hypothetical protein
MCIGLKDFASVGKYFDMLVINILEKAMTKVSGFFEGGFKNEWEQFDKLEAKLKRRKEGQYEPPEERIFIGMDNLVMVFALFGA